MTPATPVRAKSAAKSTGRALEAKLFERSKNAAPGFFQRIFRREEPPSIFHRCLAIHMHHAQQASALD